MLSSVVKGNAYGHGITEFVTMASECGIKHFSVFDVNEAKQVKAVVDDKITILIMGFVHEKDLDWIIENDIEFFVFDKKRLVNASKIAKKRKKESYCSYRNRNGNESHRL